MLEELAEDAAQENRGDEHRGEHERDGHERATHLVHRAVGGIARRQAFANIALDILHDHDGIIHHDADSEHEAEQRKIVERIADGGEDREGADQRYGDRHDRHDGRAPRLQEKDDDDDDENDRLENGLDHGFDGFGDKNGGVVDDVVAEPLRERRCKLRHSRLHGIGRFEGVGPRALEDTHRDRHALIEIAITVVVGGAELHARNVADAHDAAVAIGLDDDPAEFRGVGQAPLRLDVELEGAGLRHRRLIDHAGGDLHVLPAQRVDDIARREIADRELLRIKPDAHGIIAGTKDRHIAHAIDAGKHVLHMQRGVVGNVKEVARVVRRTQMDHHHEIGRLLHNRHADGANLFGEARLGNGDAVLNQHLCGVEIGAELERHRQRHGAVACRLRRHVKHVVDAVHFLLDRRGYGLGDNVCGRAGIGSGHLDRGRRDIGILRDRQAEIGDAADQRDEDGDDGREDRPIDEEMRQVHGAWPAAGEAEEVSTLPCSGVTFWPGRARRRPLMII